MMLAKMADLFNTELITCRWALTGNWPLPAKGVIGGESEDVMR